MQLGNLDISLDLERPVFTGLAGKYAFTIQTGKNASLPIFTALAGKYV